MERDILLNTWCESRPSHEDEPYPNQQLPSPAAHFSPGNSHSTAPGAVSYTPVLDAPTENDDDGAEDGDNELVADTERERGPRRRSWNHKLLRTWPGSRHAGYPRAYRPWSLRRDSLYGLSVLLTAMIIVLECLLQSSYKNEDLATSYENERYLWKYGPTASEY